MHTHTFKTVNGQPAIRHIFRDGEPVRVAMCTGCLQKFYGDEIDQILEGQVVPDSPQQTEISGNQPSLVDTPKGALNVEITNDDDLTEVVSESVTEEPVVEEPPVEEAPEGGDPNAGLFAPVQREEAEEEDKPE